MLDLISLFGAFFEPIGFGVVKAVEKLGVRKNS
jgi:hypothetical protein